MKKIFESFKKSYPWIMGAVFVTAILDLIGLTLPGEKEIGAGFILGVALFVALVFYHPKKKNE